jgi:hypothetical protein
MTDRIRKGRQLILLVVKGGFLVLSHVFISYRKYTIKELCGGGGRPYATGHIASGNVVVAGAQPGKISSIALFIHIVG